MSELISLLASLVAIDSVNPDLVPGGAGESGVAKFILAWAADNGLHAVEQDAGPGRPNVVVTAHGSGGGKSLMFNGHMDVVGTAGMSAPFTPRIADGRMYGRGAYDMKCGVAASLIAAKRAKALGLRGDVRVACVADEEVASIGSQAIVREMARWPADAVVVTEPTELEMIVAHKGFVWLEIETHGKAAHGSRPHLGVDAIAKMGAVLIELERLDRRLRVSRAHPHLGSGSLHASLIRGGQELSSYPAQCVLSVERRTLPNEPVALVQQQIQNILDGLAALDPDFRATLRTGLSREPFAIAEDAALVSLLSAHAKRVLGEAPKRTGAPYWADAALFSAAGIPTVMFGPTGAGAHAAEEWVDLGSVEQCADIYAALAAEMCA
jgi:acetylornithine deacetylase